MVKYGVELEGESAREFFRVLERDAKHISNVIQERLCIAIVTRAQKHYLTNARARGGLNVRTGLLRRSVWYKINSPRAGSAQVGNNTKYAPTHESPNIADRTIMPKRAKALFIPRSKKAEKGYKKGMEYGVDFVFAKKVIMPHRPTLRPAIDDIMGTDEWVKITEAALKAEFKRIEDGIKSIS